MIYLIKRIKGSFHPHESIPRPQSEVKDLGKKGEMKKLCAFLLCVVLSLTLLFFLLLLTSSSGSSTISFSPSLKHGLFHVRQQQLDKFWKERTLRSCPETPPGLVGPLQVDFDLSLTWIVVRKTLSGLSLQSGGRYKPPNCTSNHKVGNFIKGAKRHKKLL